MATVDSLVALIATETKHEFQDAAGTIRHCCQQLTDEQIWWRPQESMNSIGNLILHVCGNMRQWIVAGVGGAPDQRQRQFEFDARGDITADDLLQQLDATVAEVAAVIDGVTADELSLRRQIQAFDVSTLQAILHSMSHLRGHAQEIVYITRLQLGDNYRFALVIGQL